MGYAFERCLQDYELGSLMEIIAMVEAHNFDESKLDRLKWGSKDIFTAKECYTQVC